MMFNGLTTIHLELTSRCNKKPGCWMCGRRKLEKMGKTDWGDMPYELLEKIASQVPGGIVVQFHNNGEPLLYPKLADALDRFSHCIRCFNTNGKLLLEKAQEIIGRLECLTLSIHEDDPEMEKQHDIMTRFWAMKGNRKPQVIYRLLGKVDSEPWEEHHLKGIICRRVLHDPMGSFDYEEEPTIPEIGICLDLLTHLAIDRYGKVSPCVRFDPDRIGVIGDLNKESLEEIWNGRIRRNIIGCHLAGHRDWVRLCSKCEFWGVPTG